MVHARKDRAAGIRPSGRASTIRVKFQVAVMKGQKLVEL
jgi:hypothetical protein